MPFESDTHKEIHGKVRQWLADMVGADNVFDHGEQAFEVYRGSARIFIGVFTFREPNRVIVNVRSYLVVGPRPEPALYEYLIKENFNLVFGSFAVDKDGDVIFEQTIPGNNLDGEELKSAVNAVAWTADEYDDKIIEKWGGKTAKMMWEEKQKSGGLAW